MLRSPISILQHNAYARHAGRGAAVAPSTVVADLKRSPEEMSLLTKLFGRSSQPLPQLDHTCPLVRELKAALRALDAMPLTKKEEVESWYTAAEAFRTRVGSDWKSIYDSLPHELDHYLTDADIRAKDPDYAIYQRSILAELLTQEEAIQISEVNKQVGK